MAVERNHACIFASFSDESDDFQVQYFPLDRGKQWKVFVPSGCFQEHNNSYTRRNTTDQIDDETTLFLECIVIIN